QGDDVGVEALDLLARQVRVGGGADDLDLRVGGQQFGQDLAHDRRIVHHQYADGHQNSSTPPLTGVRDRRERTAVSAATTSAPCACGRRLTMTLPVCGKNQTLRGWMPRRSSATTGMR